MSHETKAVLIRPHRTGDEARVVRLFERVFGRPMSTAHWNWKLNSNPSAASNVWLAYRQDEPVFQYAGMPTRFWIRQRPAMVMISVDTMTAPEHRRQGLLTRVAAAAYENWSSHGIDCMLGLPNERWGSRRQALGLDALFPLQWMKRALRPQAILARRWKVPWLNRFTMATRWSNAASLRRLSQRRDIATFPMARADARFDRLWDRCKADWTFCAVRDRRWVEWRFLSCPSRRYTVTLACRGDDPVGYTAHSVEHSHDRSVAYLADLFASQSDDTAHQALLDALIESLLESDVESIQTLAVPGTAQFSRLRRAGFLPGPDFAVALRPLCTPQADPAAREPRSWNLSGADFDVV